MSGFCPLQPPCQTIYASFTDSGIPSAAPMQNRKKSKNIVKYIIYMKYIMYLCSQSKTIKDLHYEYSNYNPIKEKDNRLG